MTDDPHEMLGDNLAMSIDVHSYALVHQAIIGGMSLSNTGLSGIIGTHRR
jgi:hypothetical protein